MKLAPTKQSITVKYRYLLDVETGYYFLTIKVISVSGSGHQVGSTYGLHDIPNMVYRKCEAETKVIYTKKL